MTAKAYDADETTLHRVGGLCGIAIGAAYIIIFPLYAQVGAPPSSGEAWLKYLVGKTTVWWAILWLSVVTDLLFLPFALSLYLALKDVHRTTMLLATVLVGLFVVLDLAVTWSNYASLLTLNAEYTAATSEAQRATYVAAANYAAAVLASRVEVVYAISILSLGILMIGFVMLQGVFSRFTACLGLMTGILGIVSVAGSSVAVILNALSATVWILFSGHRLFRLSKTRSASDQTD